MLPGAGGPEPMKETGRDTDTQTLGWAVWMAAGVVDGYLPRPHRDRPEPRR